MTSLDERVQKWLSEQGYPLEMRVAQLLGAAGAGWDHGRVYRDPITEKVREIDLVGYFDPPYSKKHGLSVHVVFECKHTRDKPWVLFCSNPPYTPAGFVGATPGTERAVDALRLAAEEHPSILEMDILRPKALTGFNLVRTHTDNQDAAFHAMRGVSTSATSVAEEIGKYGHAVIYLAVIVVDTPLFECTLPTGRDETKLRRIDRGFLVYPSEPGSRIPVHVVTADALPDFLQIVSTESMTLSNLVTPFLEESGRTKAFPGSREESQVETSP
ncbi:hypothetical protein [Streptomyces sp. NRRL B-24720]|uniref:hypothetical protein n=1 Tax=Streptomyces sp. NRRL B-24720 TaxID=1476876 RepID=UPI00131AACE5|nr:hypothetical protein [Streptomyces sp. NRRL B-24720]